MAFRAFEKGFHMVFENGWTVSVQWAPMNYADHSDTDQAPFMGPVATSAEVGIWHPKVNRGKVKVSGWMTSEQVAHILARVALRSPR